MKDQTEKLSFPIVGVGASAGGLEALRELFSSVTEQTGMAFVVVQHLDPTHESLMAELIDRYTTMTVKQAEDGVKVEPENVYVIPPGHGLSIEDDTLRLTDFTDPRGLRRPIDDFFESLAKDREREAACIILSGTGADGSRGLHVIKEHGGVCIAERPESAAYDGMPSAAISTGLVDIVSEPRDMLGYLTNFFQYGGLSEQVFGDREVVDDTLEIICAKVREAFGHDFSQYKRSTLNRRIARRMQVLGIDTVTDYAQRLSDGQIEVEALFRDLLINVTSFFRDAPAFEKLKTQVIEPLVEDAREAQELRVWVPGCSSGEEAYSIAMLFADAMKRLGKKPYVQIFATDIDDAMLETARGATYPLASLADIPPQYREQYVIGGPDRFTISPNIRDMVRFSLHNLVSDPPYSKIDLISCRNLLIYFEEGLQKHVVPLFHFALKQDGHLFLGTSEAVGRYEDLFEMKDQGARLFRRKSVKGNYTLKLSGKPSRSRTPDQTRSFAAIDAQTNSIDIAAMQLVARKYAPVSLMLDREGMLLERWGAAGRYLDFPDRVERNIHVPTLARPGLREVIGPLVRKVADTNRRAGAKGVDIRTDFGTLGARVICEPVNGEAFLIVIEETRKLEPTDIDFDEFDVDDSQRQFLEDELRTTRYRLRTTVEELETANEELKSSNEEMMSMNEELQSTNEELTTVNDELKSKVDQLTVANSDLKNFFDSTRLPVLVVDRDLRLRSFTDAALALFPIDKSFIGSPLDDLPSNFSGRPFAKLARKAAIDGDQSERRIHSSTLGAEFVIRSIPYRLLDGDIDGATLVFTDVTEALSLERDLREESERLRLALEVAKIGIWEYEPSTDKTFLDDTERELLNIADSDPGDTMEPILGSLPAEDRDRVNRALRMAIEGNDEFNETFRIPLDNGQMRWLHGLGKQIDVLGERKFIGVTFDITSQKALLEQRELMLGEMNHRIKNLFAIIGGLVSLAGKDAKDVSQLIIELRSRIHALGRSHALAIGQDDVLQGEVDLGRLIDTVLEPGKTNQEVILSGHPVSIHSDHLTSVALILHEWATNSVKYGALSVADGKLDISWTQTAEVVELTWLETGRVDGLDQTANSGFGTQLVTAAAQQLKGSSTGRFTDDGFERTLVMKTAPA